MNEPRVMFIEIPATQKSRSTSPLSPSLGREKSSGFFDLLSRRFGRRSHDELFFNQTEESEETCSSSTESCSSASGQLAVQNGEMAKSRNSCSYEFNHTSGSNCSSDSGRDSVDNTNNALDLQCRPSSRLRRAMQNLTISTRSLSCSSTPSKEQAKIKAKVSKKESPLPAKKRILRQPVSYIYLKGVSGLPTQRVPRSSVCCYHTHA